MSSIRIRFSFNQGPMQVKTSGSITGIIEGAAIQYADKTFNRVKEIVQGRVEADVMGEFSLMAENFKQYVVGIGQANVAPRGTLRPSHEWSQGMPASYRRSERASSGMPSWTPRTAKYMAWKQKHFKSIKWWVNKENNIGSTPGSAKNWVSAFGPIQVKIARTRGPATGPNLKRVTNRSPYRAGKYIKFRSAEDSHINLAVANISISALTYITPGMLPALASGNMTMAADSRRTGLLNFLPYPVAKRLGGRQKAYRHTIEPFLSYFLTRAVPNALFLRVEKGLNATLVNRRNAARF